MHAPVPSLDLWFMILSEVRYSLGRMSSAPSTAQDHVKRFWEAFPHPRENLAQIAKEVRSELDRCNRARARVAFTALRLEGGWLGLEMDHRGWEAFVAWCDQAKPVRVCGNCVDWVEGGEPDVDGTRVGRCMGEGAYSENETCGAFQRRA